MNKYVSLVKAHYPNSLRNPRSIDQVKAYEINSRNFKIVSDSGSFLLKEFLTTRNASKILKIVHRCFLDEAKVPEIIKTAKGKLSVKTDGKIYCLFAYHEGRKFDGTIQQIREAGKNLAILHNSLKKQEYKIEENPAYRLLAEKEFLGIQGMLDMKKRKNKFDFSVMKMLKNFKELSTDNKTQLEGQGLPKQMIHGDFHPGNTVFKGDKLMTILDFGNMHFSERIKDVAFSCHRFTRHTPSPLHSMTNFLCSYRSESELSSKEVDSIPHFIVREALRRISYILRSHYFEDCKTWDFELRKHLGILEEAKDLGKEFWHAGTVQLP